MRYGHIQESRIPAPTNGQFRKSIYETVQGPSRPYNTVDYIKDNLNTNPYEAQAVKTIYGSEETFFNKVNKYNPAPGGTGFAYQPRKFGAYNNPNLTDSNVNVINEISKTFINPIPVKKYLIGDDYRPLNVMYDSRLKVVNPKNPVLMAVPDSELVKEIQREILKENIKNAKRTIGTTDFGINIPNVDSRLVSIENVDTVPLSQPSINKEEPKGDEYKITQNDIKHTALSVLVEGNVRSSKQIPMLKSINTSTSITPIMTTNLGTESSKSSPFLTPGSNSSTSSINSFTSSERRLYNRIGEAYTSINGKLY